MLGDEQDLLEEKLEIIFRTKVLTFLMKIQSTMRRRQRNEVIVLKRPPHRRKIAGIVGRPPLRAAIISAALISTIVTEAGEMIAVGSTTAKGSTKLLPIVPRRQVLGIGLKSELIHQATGGVTTALPVTGADLDHLLSPTLLVGNLGLKIISN